MSDERNSRLAVRGGVGVIFATGLMAVLYGIMEDGDGLVLTLIVVAITLVGMFAIVRFISRHGDEIGEARFDTRNKDTQSKDEREP